MNIFWEELTTGFTGDAHGLRVLIRVSAAILLGGLIGLQRVSPRKPASLRTHTLVCVGATVLVLFCSAAAFSPDGASRVIQGVLTGIGFIGAGSILKVAEEHLVHGLTASARVWTTTAVGIAIGLGQLGIAFLTALLVLVIVALPPTLVRRMKSVRHPANLRLTSQGRERPRLRQPD